MVMKSPEVDEQCFKFVEDAGEKAAQFFLWRSLREIFGEAVDAL